MKKLYTTFIFTLLLTFVLQAQTYEFSISFIGINSGTQNYQMALLATPSSTAVGQSTDDMGAGFYVPDGITLGEFATGNSGIPFGEWESLVMSNTSSAFFLSRVESGSNSIELNGDGPFELVLFDIISDPNPTTGEIVFVENGDPVFNELLFIENYINIASINQYSQNNPGANSIEFATLGTQEISIPDNSISVYPNPATEFINISSSYKILNVTLYDILGKQILNQDGIDKIPVRNYKSGIYILNIVTDKGTLIKKIVIE